MGRTVFWTLSALIVASLFTIAPGASAQEGSDVVVTGQHVISVLKGSRDAVANVNEFVSYRNGGTDAYDGPIVLDLDPDADLLQVSVVRNQVPVGNAFRAPFANQTVGDHVRYTIDLAAGNVSFEPNGTYTLSVLYTLPGTDLEFTRGFAVEHPALTVRVGRAPGIVPLSDDGQFVAVSFDWDFGLDAAGQATTFPAGSAFNFTWVETQVPLSPLTASIAVQRVAPLVLQASASGGIAPYTFTWDTDADGECDDAEGRTVEVANEVDATHQVTVCVADSAQPPATLQEAFVARTVPDRVAPSGWLLALIGLAVGGLLAFGLVQGGILPGRQGGGAGARPAGGDRASLAVESRDMLEARQRVMIAGLKELELAKKKGEVAESLYTPLKAELKQDTVRVMREIEKRKGETV